jgi:hypothetical protein
VALRGLDPKVTYELTREGTAAIRVSGADLMGRYQLTIPERGLSLLVLYRKAGQ